MASWQATLSGLEDFLAAPGATLTADAPTATATDSHGVYAATTPITTAPLEARVVRVTDQPSPVSLTRTDALNLPLNTTEPTPLPAEEVATTAAAAATAPPPTSPATAVVGDQRMGGSVANAMAHAIAAAVSRVEAYKSLLERTQSTAATQTRLVLELGALLSDVNASLDDSAPHPTLSDDAWHTLGAVVGAAGAAGLSTPAPLDSWLRRGGPPPLVLVRAAAQHAAAEHSSSSTSLLASRLGPQAMRLLALSGWRPPSPSKQGQSQGLNRGASAFPPDADVVAAVSAAHKGLPERLCGLAASVAVSSRDAAEAHRAALAEAQERLSDAWATIRELRHKVATFSSLQQQAAAQLQTQAASIAQLQQQSQLQAQQQRAVAAHTASLMSAAANAEVGVGGLPASSSSPSASTSSASPRITTTGTGSGSLGAVRGFGSSSPPRMRTGVSSVGGLGAVAAPGRRLAHASASADTPAPAAVEGWVEGRAPVLDPATLPSSDRAVGGIGPRSSSSVPTSAAGEATNGSAEAPPLTASKLRTPAPSRAPVSRLPPADVLPLLQTHAPAASAQRRVGHNEAGRSASVSRAASTTTGTRGVAGVVAERQALPHPHDGGVAGGRGEGRRSQSAVPARRRLASADGDGDDAGGGVATARHRPLSAPYPSLSSSLPRPPRQPTTATAAAASPRFNRQPQQQGQGHQAQGHQAQRGEGGAQRVTAAAVRVGVTTRAAAAGVNGRHAMASASRGGPTYRAAGRSAAVSTASAPTSTPASHIDLDTEPEATAGGGGSGGGSHRRRSSAAAEDAMSAAAHRIRERQTVTQQSSLVRRLLLKRQAGHPLGH